MNSPLLPNSADALLFDLGRVVLDIDFGKVVASWAGHAGCEPAHLVGRFSPDEACGGTNGARSATPLFLKACARRSGSTSPMCSFSRDGTRSLPAKCPGS